MLESIQFHFTLQQIGLLPFRPFLPSLMALVPFTATSLIRPFRLPHAWTVSESLDTRASLATSPIVLHYFLGIAMKAVSSKADDHVRLALPKPDNPNNTSMAVAFVRQDDSAYIGGFDILIDDKTHELVRDVHAVRELAEKDCAYVRNRSTSLASWCRSTIVRDPNPGFSRFKPTSRLSTTSPLRHFLDLPRSLRTNTFQSGPMN